MTRPPRATTSIGGSESRADFVTTFVWGSILSSFLLR
jgi:hypothetical protein